MEQLAARLGGVSVGCTHTGDGSLILRHCTILNPVLGRLEAGRDIIVRDGTITSISASGDSDAASGEWYDMAGLVLLPGLIDCHVHVTAFTANLATLGETSPSYATAASARIMEGMLRRGFTTVRDAGGADFGLAMAIEEGLIVGPRLFFGGSALSQTGGHGDFRQAGRRGVEAGEAFPTPAVLCDGVTEVRRASREILRTGAHHLKLMLSGGVASPTDRVESTQFAIEEIRAAVDEASAAKRYVMGHAYTAEAINRGLDSGVRSIEHGNLLDESSIERLLRYDAFLVPTLVAYRAIAEDGLAVGLPASSVAKVGRVLDSGAASLEKAYRAGVHIAYGTDLLGGLQGRQSEEFSIRGQVQPAVEVIRSATTIAASLLGHAHDLGQIAVGFLGDIVAVDEDPMRSLEVLSRPELHVKLVVKGGVVAYTTGVPHHG